MTTTRDMHWAYLCLSSASTIENLLHPFILVTLGALNPKIDVKKKKKIPHPHPFTYDDVDI